MVRFPKTSSFFARLQQDSKCQMAWDVSSRKAYTEHTNPDPYVRRPSAPGCTRTKPQYVEAGNERCVCVMRESEELAPINLDELRGPGLKIEKTGKSIIMIINTDEMLITYSDNVRELVDFFKKKLNNFFEVTPCSKIKQFMGMHVLHDKQKGLLRLTLDARRHVYDFINHMGLDPHSCRS